MKFQKSSMHDVKVMLSIFLRYLAFMVKILKLPKGHNSRFFFRIVSKVNQVIYLSFPISLSSLKSIASIFEISCLQG